jgi:hypothetical protein
LVSLLEQRQRPRARFGLQQLLFSKVCILGFDSVARAERRLLD